MNIVHIGTADNSGGAARAAFRLHTGLLERGHQSRMLVGFQTEQRAEIDHIPDRSTLARKALTQVVWQIERRTGLQYLLLPWKRKFLSHPFVRNADIIQFHNLHGGFFSHTILPELSRIAPLVWTLHDEWPVTGHCTYPSLYGCDRWKVGCGRCPALDDYPPIDVDTTGALWRTKDRAYRQSDITVVGPSAWIADVARTSPLLGRYQVHQIPYGIDAEVFRPVRKAAAREALGVPQDARVVLFLSHVVTSERKGFRYLAEALDLIGAEVDGLELLTVGEGILGPDALPAGIRHRHLGAIDNETLMNAVYNAADVYVLPTLADNLPNTIIESMASGTPAVAFEVGGVPDLVRHMETGYLARYRSAADLGTGVRMLLTDEALRSRLGRAGRALVERELTRERQAERYEQLYVQLRETRSREAHRNARPDGRRVTREPDRVIA